MLKAFSVYGFFVIILFIILALFGCKKTPQNDQATCKKYGGEVNTKINCRMMFDCEADKVWATKSLDGEHCDAHSFGHKCEMYVQCDWRCENLPAERPQ